MASYRGVVLHIGDMQYVNVAYCVLGSLCDVVIGILIIITEVFLDTISESFE